MMRALLLLLLVQGCSLIGNIEKIGCGIVPEGKDREHCYQDAAVRLSDPSVCERILGTGWEGGDGNPRKNKCYRRIAEKTGDIALCEKLEPGKFAETRMDCYGLVASAKGNPSLCQKAPPDYMDAEGLPVYATRDACMAKAGGALCQGLLGEELFSCAVNNGLHLCERLPEADQGRCLLYSIADNLPKKPECRVLNDPMLKYSCHIFASYGAQEDNECDMIHEPAYREYCIFASIVNVPLSGNPDSAYRAWDERYRALCENMEGFMKAYCYFNYGSEHYSHMRDNVWYEQYAPIREKAYLAELKGCQILGTLDIKDDMGLVDSFEIRCFSDLIQLQYEGYCKALEGEEKDTCLAMESMYTGVCIEMECRMFSNVKPRMDECRKLERNGITEESWDCEQQVKDELIRENNIPTVEKMLVKQD